jgi:hypothetical protein
LVLVRLEGGQVQENGGATAAGTAVQRGGDQIAQTAGLQDVLGRKEPIVA